MKLRIEPLDLESFLIIAICGAVLILAMEAGYKEIASTIVGGFMGYLTKSVISSSLAHYSEDARDRMEDSEVRKVTEDHNPMMYARQETTTTFEEEKKK